MRFHYFAVSTLFATALARPGATVDPSTQTGVIDARSLTLAGVTPDAGFSLFKRKGGRTTTTTTTTNKPKPDENSPDGDDGDSADTEETDSSGTPSTGPTKGKPSTVTQSCGGRKRGLLSKRAVGWCKSATGQDVYMLENNVEYTPWDDAKTARLVEALKKVRSGTDFDHPDNDDLKELLEPELINPPEANKGYLYTREGHDAAEVQAHSATDPKSNVGVAYGGYNIGIFDKRVAPFKELFDNHKELIHEYFGYTSALYVSKFKGEFIAIISDMSTGDLLKAKGGSGKPAIFLSHELPVIEKNTDVRYIYKVKVSPAELVTGDTGPAAAAAVADGKIRQAQDALRTSTFMATVVNGEVPSEGIIYDRQGQRGPNTLLDKITL